MYAYTSDNASANADARCGYNLRSKIFEQVVLVSQEFSRVYEK